MQKSFIGRAYSPDDAQRNANDRCDEWIGQQQGIAETARTVTSLKRESESSNRWICMIELIYNASGGGGDE